MSFSLNSFLLFIILFLPASSQANTSEGEGLKRFEYDLSSPCQIFNLPPPLQEISGIAELDLSSIACVQDENGIIFIYDINKGLISRRFIFGAQGDYEDLARVNENLYVLRSDEVLIEIINFRSEKYGRKAYQAQIPGKNTEGICYDKANDRLLLVPKEIPDKDSFDKNKRYIYSFNLKTGEVIDSPVISLDLNAIEKFAVDNSVKVPMKKKKGKKEKPDIKLKISAMGIHPITKRLFVISGPERLLFVFNLNGDIEYVERLDKDLFPQPEGLTFMPDGDMFISNEGRNGSPTLIRFKFMGGSGR